MSRLNAARASLDEVGRLNRAARAPRTEVWFPLLLFGLVNLGAAPVVLLVGREHLGAYFFPLNVCAGALCAWHYWRRGRVTGLQAPLFAWLGVILAVTFVAAFASYQGREQDWPALNLAGPGIALVLGYALLAAWARSLTLLVAVAAMATAVATGVTVARGDVAIALQTGAFAVILLTLSLLSYRLRRRPA